MPVANRYNIDTTDVRPNDLILSGSVTRGSSRLPFTVAERKMGDLHVKVFGTDENTGQAGSITLHGEGTVTVERVEQTEEEKNAAAWAELEAQADAIQQRLEQVRAKAIDHLSKNRPADRTPILEMVRLEATLDYARAMLTLRDDNTTALEAQRRIQTIATKRAIDAARYPARSTSPWSNLMDDERNAAIAEVAAHPGWAMSKYGGRG